MSLESDCMSVSYFVYENRNYDVIRVHKNECVYCRCGAGLKGNGSQKRSIWTGPYTSIKDAVDAALLLGRLDTAGCRRCLQDLNI